MRLFTRHSGSACRRSSRQISALSSFFFFKSRSPSVHLRVLIALTGLSGGAPYWPTDNASRTSVNHSYSFFFFIRMTYSFLLLCYQRITGNRRYHVQQLRIVLKPSRYIFSIFLPSTCVFFFLAYRTRV